MNLVLYPRYLQQQYITLISLFSITKLHKSVMFLIRHSVLLRRHEAALSKKRIFTHSLASQSWSGSKRQWWWRPFSHLSTN
jgi:hypothetical protein